MKRFVGILAALALCLCLLPQCAWAAEALGAINLQSVTDNQSGDGWTWDVASRTLALKNCDLVFRSEGFVLPSGTVVTVEGTNSIVVGANHTSGTALFVDSRATSSEPFNMTVKSAPGGGYGYSNRSL